MKRRSPIEIQSAADECLAHCKIAPNPLDGLVEYISGLKSQKWHPEDLWMLESAVVKILAKLSSNEYDALDD